MAKRVRVGPLEMEYEDAGAGPRPFVLVHGFTGSRDDWTDVLPALAAHGRTVAPDQRGHGGTTNPGTPEDYTLEQLVADLVGFLDAAQVPRCDLLGHSMGGMVAIRLALEHPGRLSSLVLMNTAARPVTSMPRDLFEAAARTARTLGTAKLFEAFRMSTVLGPGLPGAVQRAAEAMGEERYWERLRAKFEAMDAHAFEGLGRALHDQAPLTHRLGEIGCPTTVVVGAGDEPFLEPSAELAAGIPGAEHVVIPDAVHSPQIENRDAWLAAIEAHLGRVRAGAR